MLRWLCIVFLFPAVANTAPLLMTVGELRALCKSSSTEQRAACDAYIVGVAEGNVATLGVVADVLKEREGINYVGPYYCPDRKGDRERLIGPVRNAVTKSKDEPHSPAIWGVLAALRESFPCSK